MKSAKSRSSGLKAPKKTASRRKSAPAAVGDFSTVGRKIDNVEVQFGTRLLKHFSEQLYASPNKSLGR